MSAVQRDQATIRARDTRIAALETDVARYLGQFKNVLARAVEKNSAREKRQKTPKPEKLKRKIPKKLPRISRTKRRAKRKPHGQRR